MGTPATNQREDGRKLAREAASVMERAQGALGRYEDGNEGSGLIAQVDTLYGVGLGLLALHAAVDGLTTVILNRPDGSS